MLHGFSTRKVNCLFGFVELNSLEKRIGAEDNRREERPIQSYEQMNT